MSSRTEHRKLVAIMFLDMVGHPEELAEPALERQPLGKRQYQLALVGRRLSHKPLLRCA